MSTYKLKKGVVDNLESSLSGKSSTDLDNLSQTGEAHFANASLTNSPYTTNRILEIPQDIKLELNDGVLTLKAGSKVYVPNGFESDGATPKFNVVTTANDIVYNTVTTTTGKSLFFLYPDLVIGAFTPPGDAAVSYYFSGPTAPTVTLTYALWYDTANNVIKNTFDNGATWTPGNSLPFSICSYTTGTGATAIDQVFNGFGYIGSTTFILPGVKWQRCAQSINYGKNADSTNASVIRSNSSVLLVNHPDTITSTHYICVSDGGGAARYTSRGSKIVYYDESKNAWYNDYSETYVYIIPLLEEHTTAGRVDSFTPYSVDSVANSNLSNLSSAAASNLNSKGIRTVIETYNNGSNWYRIWSDGWIEQGGSTGLQGANSYTRTTVTFLKPFKDTNYTITNAPNKYSTQNGLSQAYPPFIYTKNTKTCVFGGFCWTDGFDWYACGY